MLLSLYSFSTVIWEKLYGIYGQSTMIQYNKLRLMIECQASSNYVLLRQVKFRVVGEQPFLENDVLHITDHLNAHLPSGDISLDLMA